MIIYGSDQWLESGHKSMILLKYFEQKNCRISLLVKKELANMPFSYFKERKVATSYENLAKEYIANGANSVIIGTRANEEFLKQLQKEKVIVALDTKDGKIAVEGWKKLERADIYKKIKKLEDYCYKFLITNVNVEGLNEGTDLNFFETLVEKTNGLIPTIVQDKDTKEVLMLAYSNKESLQKTYEIKKATYYYSRSRQSLWTKGEKSGNIQNIEKIYLDCDSDTILFLVNQKGVACHRNKRTCFEI